MSTRRPPLLVVLVAGGLALASCSSGGEQGCDPSNPICGGGGGGTTPSVSSVTVTSSIDTVMAKGGNATLSAVAKDASAATVSVTFMWTSLSTPVATVNAATGAVTGVSAGTATIRAAQNNNSVTGDLRMHVVDADLPAVTTTLQDAFAQSLRGALTTSPQTAANGFVVTCVSNATSGNILAIDSCLNNLSNVSSADTNDQALLGVLGLFHDHAQRQLGL